MKTRSLFVLVFLCFCVGLSAQDLIKIKGKVLTIEDKPIEYVTILLEDKEHGIIKEGVVDDKGNFEVEVEQGEYNLVIEPLGFDLIQKEVTLSSNVYLGVFKAKIKESLALDAAVVTSNKKIYKIELGEKVYDVANDLMSKGKTLSDVLANIPSVQVDENGNILLRGNDDILFLIDGKPSGMLGVSEVGEALKNISAENVERIELVTNPSAKYEASGSAGVINIILKKGANLGFNGSVSVNSGLPKMLGTNVNINYKTKNYSLYTILGTRYTETNNNEIILATNYSNKKISDYRKSDVKKDNFLRNYSVRLGGEYFFNDKNTLGLSIGYGINNESNINMINYFYSIWNLNNNQFRKENSKLIAKNFDTDINYKHEFNKKGHELVLTGRYSYGNENTDGLINQFDKNNNILSRENIYNFGKRNTIVFIGDYIYPFNEAGKLELGFRTDFADAKLNNGSNQILDDGTILANKDLSINMINKESIYSGYIQYGNRIGKFQYLVGLRVENSNIKINNHGTKEILNKKYTDLFPTLRLNYKFTDDKELQLSYSRSILRPLESMLTPLFINSYELNIFKGNPFLSPKYTNSIEISYVNSVGKLMITPSIYYQKNIGVFQEFERYNNKLTQDENGNDIYNKVYISKTVNAGNEELYGLDLTATYRPFKWWNLMLNFNLYKYIYKGVYRESSDDYLNPATGNVETRIDSQNYNGNGLGSNGRLLSNFTLPSNFKIQIVANYDGKIKTEQQKKGDNFFMDFSMSKDVMKNKGTITFNISDILNSRRSQLTTYYTNSENYRNNWKKQMFNLSFTYRFK